MNRKPDLLQDAQVRAQVVQTLYALIPANPVVAFLATALLLWQVAIPQRSASLAIALLCWLGLNLVYLALYLRFRRTTKSSALSAAASALYLRRFYWVALLDAAIFGAVCVLVYFANPEMYAVATVGCAIYLFGDVFKNMVYSRLTNVFPFVIFGPLAVAFFYAGTPVLMTLAIILLISTFAMLEFSRSNAYTLQLAIKQRYDISRQNHELAELTRKLGLERERADAANAAKSNFFTAASHDARQPLQVIGLLFQAFQRSAPLSDQNKALIEKIEINLNSIRSLFDRVLDISRIDAGSVTPVVQAVSLQAVFDKLDAQFGELAASRGLWLRFVPTSSWVAHDPELLERIISNLVHNAIKYTQQGGVWVAWRQVRQRVEIRDSGIGISLADQSVVFNEFAQLNNPSRNNSAGLGLGLSIVRRLAELTESPIGLASALGRGSCFWLELKQTTRKPDKVLEGGALSNSEADTDQYAASASDALSVAGLQLLYVEDQEELRKEMAQLLRGVGLDVHECATLDQVSAVLHGGVRLDLVLTDFRLGSGGSGLDVVQLVRSHASDGNAKAARGRLPPVVILTGDTAIKDLQAIRQLENCVLLHKPVDFVHLLGVLRTAGNTHD